MNRLECYRAASIALDTWFCNGTVGRSKTDPVYQMVVEGRDVPATYKSYSSCADRAHAKLFRLGCREKFVNREERTPLPRDWHIGANISSLHDVNQGSPCLFGTDEHGRKFAAQPSAGWEPSPGDELLIWNSGNDAHSLSVISYDGSRAVTANYGRTGMTAVVFPGATLSNAPLIFKSGHWWYGEGARQKQVMRVLRLVDYIDVLSAKANLDGVPFDQSFTGEVADFIVAERA